MKKVMASFILLAPGTGAFAHENATPLIHLVDVDYASQQDLQKAGYVIIDKVLDTVDAVVPAKNFAATYSGGERKFRIVSTRGSSYVPERMEYAVKALKAAGYVVVSAEIMESSCECFGIDFVLPCSFESVPESRPDTVSSGNSSGPSDEDLKKGQELVNKIRRENSRENFERDMEMLRFKTDRIVREAEQRMAKYRL